MASYGLAAILEAVDRGGLAEGDNDECGRGIFAAPIPTFGESGYRERALDWES